MIRVAFILLTASAFAVPVYANDKVEDEERRMFPDGMSHDFGKVARGTVHGCTFRIVNTSSHELEITNVRVSMSIDLSAWTVKNRLKPGETGTINVRQDTGMFFGSKTTRFFVTYTIGGRFREARFWVQCDSDKSMLPSDNWRNLGEVRQGAVLKHSFQIVNTYKQPMRIVGLRPDHGDGLAMRSDKQTLQPNESATIEMQLDSSKFTGRTQRTPTVIVEVDGKRHNIAFTLWATSVEPLTFDHQRMFPDGTNYSFAFDDTTPAYKRSFRIVNEGRAAIKIVDVQGKPGPLAVVFSAKAIEPGQTGTFELTVANSRLTDAQTYTCTVTLEIVDERRVVDLTATAVRTPMSPQPVLPAPRPGTSRDPF
ncbi:MAG: DUF1573 domain-containing protein [Gemmataceae bacterium]|nr:DUF1573 domain-containing protein [Gemmataceae bacterium]